MFLANKLTQKEFLNILIDILTELEKNDVLDVPEAINIIVERLKFT